MYANLLTFAIVVVCNILTVARHGSEGSPYPSTPISVPKAQNTGLGNSVCTLYELHSGEDSADQGMYVITFTHSSQSAIYLYLCPGLSELSRVLWYRAVDVEEGRTGTG